MVRFVSRRVIWSLIVLVLVASLAFFALTILLPVAQVAHASLADEAARQCKAHKHTLQAELALYITHGLLHNLGFDDAETEASAEMHRTEDEILQEAGFGKVFDKQS